MKEFKLLIDEIKEQDRKINELSRKLGSKENRRISNGIGCLAAQIIAHFKTEPGYFYLHSAGSRDMCEEFIYTLYIYNKDKLAIKVEDTYDKGHVLFDGDLKQYEKWLNSKDKKFGMAEAAEYKI